METKIPDSWRPYTGQQWKILILLLFVNLLIGMTSTIQGPFYPKEAEKKGLSAAEYGLVFGIYHLTQLITSPVLGSYMEKIGGNIVFSAGVVLTGGSLILFGFLDKIYSTAYFLSFSLLLRVLEGIGSTGAIVYIYASVPKLFPNSVATTFAQLETAFAFGFCIAPVFGEFLFQIGGYNMPFAVLGGILIVSLMMSKCLLVKSSDTEYSVENNVTVVEQRGMTHLLMIPTVLAAAYGVFVAAFTSGFLVNTLEHHIRQFDLSPSLTGLTFFSYGLVYAVTTPLFGSICDRLKEPTFLTFFGGLLVFTAFVAVGPASFIPIKPILWLTIAGLSMFGLGLGAIFVSTFLIFLKDARRHNYPDSAATYCLVSALWFAMYALGSLTGPVVSGILQDRFGFRNATYAILVLSFVLVLVSILSILKRRSLLEQNLSVSSEKTPLIKSGNHSE